MFVIETDFQGANISLEIRFTEGLYRLLGETAGQFDLSVDKLVLHCCRYALHHLSTTDDL